jgi:hypothetical protein
LLVHEPFIQNLLAFESVQPALLLSTGVAALRAKQTNSRPPAVPAREKSALTRPTCSSSAQLAKQLAEVKELREKVRSAEAEKQQK